MRVLVFLFVATIAFATDVPRAPGKLVDIGGHKLHVHCMGKGSPTVVVENGFDEFSTDWVLVRNRPQGSRESVPMIAPDMRGASRVRNHRPIRRSTLNCTMR